MLESLHLKNVGPAPEMEMGLAPRLNLITGDNGLGKSFLLDVAWWALTRRWPQEINPKLTSGYPARPSDVTRPATIEFRVRAKSRSVAYESRYVPREEAWMGKAGRPWNPGLVIYAHTDGGFSVWDPARNYWTKKGNIDVQDRLPGFVFSAREVWDGLEADIKGQRTVVCNGLIRDWASWIRESGLDSEWMDAVLAVMSPSLEERDRLIAGPLTRISVSDARDIPSIRTGSVKAVPILHASSGVRRIVALTYVLLWSVREHRVAAHLLGDAPTNQVVLLIDEIESHLHPRWQRSILGSLLSVAAVLYPEATIQLITATHSPLVLASAEPIFDADQDAWFDLDWNADNNGGRVELRKRTFVSHGDVSNWLTSEAFDLKVSRSIPAENAIEKARALLRRRESPTLAEAQAVDIELRHARLPDIDPFWVRWGAFMEEIGGAG